MKGKNPSRIKARQLWSPGPRDHAREHFQGRDELFTGSLYSANVQVVCLDCRTKPVFSEDRVYCFFFFVIIIWRAIEIPLASLFLQSEEIAAQSAAPKLEATWANFRWIIKY